MAFAPPSRPGAGAHSTRREQTREHHGPSSSSTYRAPTEPGINPTKSAPGPSKLPSTFPAINDNATIAGTTATRIPSLNRTTPSSISSSAARSRASTLASPTDASASRPNARLASPNQRVTRKPVPTDMVTPDATPPGPTLDSRQSTTPAIGRSNVTSSSPRRVASSPNTSTSAASSPLSSVNPRSRTSSTSGANTKVSSSRSKPTDDSRTLKSAKSSSQLSVSNSARASSSPSPLLRPQRSAASLSPLPSPSRLASPSRPTPPPLSPKSPARLASSSSLSAQSRPTATDAASPRLRVPSGASAPGTPRKTNSARTLETPKTAPATTPSYSSVPKAQAQPSSSLRSDDLSPSSTSPADPSVATQQRKQQRDRISTAATALPPSSGPPPPSLPSSDTRIQSSALREERTRSSSASALNARTTTQVGQAKPNPTPSRPPLILLKDTQVTEPNQSIRPPLRMVNQPPTTPRNHDVEDVPRDQIQRRQRSISMHSNGTTAEGRDLPADTHPELPSTLMERERMRTRSISAGTQAAPPPPAVSLIPSPVLLKSSSQEGLGRSSSRSTSHARASTMPTAPTSPVSTTSIPRTSRSKTISSPSTQSIPIPSAQPIPPSPHRAAQNSSQIHSSSPAPKLPSGHGGMLDLKELWSKPATMGHTSKEPRPGRSGTSSRSTSSASTPVSRQEKILDSQFNQQKWIRGGGGLASPTDDGEGDVSFLDMLSPLMSPTLDGLSQTLAPSRDLEKAASNRGSDHSKGKEKRERNVLRRKPSASKLVRSLSGRAKDMSLMPTASLTPSLSSNSSPSGSRAASVQLPETLPTVGELAERKRERRKGDMLAFKPEDVAAALTPAGEVALAYKRASQTLEELEKEPPEESVTPYYTVIGSTSGKLVAVGSPEDSFADLRTSRSVVSSAGGSTKSGIGSLKRKVSGRWGKTTREPSPERVTGRSASLELGHRPRMSLDRFTGTSSIPHMRKLPSLPLPHSGTSKLPVFTMVQPLHTAPPDHGLLSNQPRSRKSEPNPAGKNKIWKLMKRISTGGMREKFAEGEFVAADAPPVPKLPDLPSFGLDRLETDKSQGSTEEQHLPATTSGTTSSYTPSPSSRPSMSTNHTRSTSPSSSAKSKFFGHRRRSSSSSISSSMGSMGVVAPPVPRLVPQEQTTKWDPPKRIIAPKDLHKLDLSFQDHISSPLTKTTFDPDSITTPPTVRPKANRKSAPGPLGLANDADDYMIVRSPQETPPSLLPLPLRMGRPNPSKSTRGPKVQGRQSPDIPEFSTAGAVNAFRSRTVSSPTTQDQISPRSDTRRESMPARTDRNGRRPFAALQSALEKRNSFGIPYLSMHSEAQASISSSSRTASLSASSSPGTASPTKLSRPVTPASAGAAKRSEREKTEMWEELLERSERAGGTLTLRLWSEVELDRS